MTSAPVTSALSVTVLTVATRWSRRIAVGTIALGLVALFLPSGAHDVLVLVLVVLGLLAGLPHGSVDHRLAAGLTGRPALLVAAGYAGVAVLTWILLSTVGLVALVPVLALSLVHFALGELEVLRATTGWCPSWGAGVAAAVAGTGALLLPLARSDAQMVAVAGSISPQLGALLGVGPIRIALVAVWVLAAVTAVVPALRAHRPGVALDVVLIGALGALAPPLVAFAVWFGGWHALRHCARMLVLDGPSAALVADGQPREAIYALARAALGPSLAAVAVLVVLVVATATSADPAAAVGATLVVLLALTVPHMLVVLAFDRRALAEYRG